MTLSRAEAREALDDLLGAQTREADRLRKLHNAFRGRTPGVYMPKGANAEYKELAEKANTNYLPLVVDVIMQSLRIEGYRGKDSPDNAAAWKHWQANQLDARQVGVHRAALTYGLAYVTVLPGDTGPVIRGATPRRLTAMFEDWDADEWPAMAVATSWAPDSFGVPSKAWAKLYDDEAVYEFVQDGGDWQLREPRHHGLGVTPVVRFRDRMDLEGQPVGLIEPLLPIQAKITETEFGRLLAQAFGAFRQRWVTGMSVPTDENGEPVEPFKSAVDRLWVAEDDTTRFGEFEHTPLEPFIASKDSAVQDMASISQTPPHQLLGKMANLSAEALVAAESGKNAKVDEISLSLGESWEQTLRLAALADGDTEGSKDFAAQVRWRDTTARSLAQTVDALGKLAQMLNVPPRALWERIPGVTQQDVERWSAMQDELDPLAAMTGVLSKQAEAVKPDAVASGAGADRAA